MFYFARNVRRRDVLIRVNLVWFLLACLLAVLPSTTAAQTWNWTKEVVDTTGKGISLTVDELGNVHVSYGANEEGLKYAFRPAGDQSQWFKMVLGGGVSYTNIAVDHLNNPHICSTYFSLPLRYFHFDGKQWEPQEVNPVDRSSVQHQCAVAVSRDGLPHVTWYELPHLRYAVLENGIWMMHTLDSDLQTGKWHSMILDDHGYPCISYDAFIKGLLNFTRWDGQKWNKRVVDARGAHGTDYSLGMGSSVAFDPRGTVHITYYSDSEMRHAWQDGDKWKVETVDRVTPTGGFADYRDSLVFDSDGFPHISYEDHGALKHAYFDGKEWNIQIVAPAGISLSRFSSMGIDAKRNILYLAYQDPSDGSLRVAVGRKGDQPQTAAGTKSSHD